MKQFSKRLITESCLIVNRHNFFKLKAQKVMTHVLHAGRYLIQYDDLNKLGNFRYPTGAQ